MTITQEHQTTLVLMTCPIKGCGVAYGLSENYRESRQDDHATWYCPNGHSLHFPGESELEKTQRLLANAKRREGWAEAHATSLRDQLDSTERSRRALKGHLTRARNKIANGVCPVVNCRRHFDNVQAHIQSEHPTWHVTDPETGKAAVL